jgi:hypothetical protein
MVALPRVDANENILPMITVYPKDQKFYGPCTKSTNFKIELLLWNDMALTGQDVYAFDFDISWAGISWITMVSEEMHSPWTNYFIIDNQNDTMDADGLPTDWHLGLTAYPPSGGLNYVNMSVLTIWFHIEVDACYPGNLDGEFIITGKMSGDGDVPVDIDGEFDGGFIHLISMQPKVKMTTTDPAFSATFNNITEKCVSHTFDIEIDAVNVTNLFAFGLKISYDYVHLETDPQKITPKPSFAGPYEYALVIVGPNVPNELDAGEILIVMARPSEKPGICGMLVPLVDIVFHTIDDAYDPPDNLPLYSLSTIQLEWAFFQSKCGQVIREYDYPTAITPAGIGIDYGYPANEVYLGGFATRDHIHYVFKPSTYDLTEDCVVDVNDLKVLLFYYPGVTAVGGFGDLYDDVTNPQAIDIFDFVAIAKNFGAVDP